ncbi:MAG: tryptophan 2,3-dioxygenase family protein [Planctomycetota bacterium]|nr:tryptophan 2,3-dioxygenase family protein [Planctomycetota bacterium]
MPLNYATYLRIDELLDLQVPRSDPPEHDEYLFIVIHQTYELWFKLLLIEFEKVGADFSANRPYDALHTLRRCRNILKTLVGQMDVLETMTPMSFTSFRDRLEDASGFQSLQFREMEFLLGYKRPEMLKYAPAQGPALERVQRRLAEPSLVDRFYDFLGLQGAAVPTALRAKDVAEPTRADPALQDELLRLHKTRPDLVLLFEALTDIDEGIQEWRYRHVKLVERTIGNKGGTGGSLGVEFLKRSLFKPLFPDLWAIRHRL